MRLRSTQGRRRAAVALAILLFLAPGVACSLSEVSPRSLDAGSGPTSVVESRDQPTVVVEGPVRTPVGPPPTSDPSSLPRLTARSDRDLPVFDRTGSADAAEVLPSTNSFGSPIALPVTRVGEGPEQGWLQVQLPGRPNGRSGWVRAADVALREVAHEVRIDLASRTLQVVERNRVLLSTAVAVGAAESPTPTGVFFLTDKLVTGEPDGLYGPFALGLSARSEVLTEFAGGDAQVGIHGTNAPDSIGRAVSHGCIRVPNDVAVRLAEVLSLGTPVVVG